MNKELYIYRNVYVCNNIRKQIIASIFHFIGAVIRSLILHIVYFLCIYTNSKYIQESPHMN